MKKKLLAVALTATMMLSSVMSVFAVDAKDTISGDLTVTTFFNEKTDAVELKSGDSYTFKFKDKCGGTNNYENYVMAITGAIGDEYTGADQEVLILRADSWGWGGKMSDFAAPDAAAGNKLVFENSIGEDWATWLAAAQAGFDCEVTIARDGNSLKYDAKTGDHTISCTATSGIDLPESCYVFFTGENCTLSGITTTKGQAESIKPAETTEAPSTTSEDQKMKPSVADKGDNQFVVSTAAEEEEGNSNTVIFIAIAVVAVVVIAGVVVVVTKKKK